MSTVYSSAIDDTSTLPVAADLATINNSDVYNRLRAAIIAVETELGVKPSGTFGTVRARLDNLDAEFQALTDSTIHEVRDHGTPLAGGPFTILNFAGTGVVLTNGGSGVANVNITGGGGGGGGPTDHLPILDPALEGSPRQLYAMDHYDAGIYGDGLTIGGDASFTPSKTFEFMTILANTAIDWSADPTGLATMSLDKFGVYIENGKFLQLDNTDIGTSGAQSGKIRLSLGDEIYTRNNAGTGDLGILATLFSSTDILAIGTNTAFTKSFPLVKIIADGEVQINANVGSGPTVRVQPNSFELANDMWQGFTTGVVDTTLPAIGKLRFPYNSGSAVVVVGAKDSINSDRAFITYGSGDAWTIGNTVQDLNLQGNSLQGNFPGNICSITHIGFQLYSTAAATYGFFSDTNASTALGPATTVGPVGSLAHSTQPANCIGLVAVDLYGAGNAAPVNLTLKNGTTELLLSNTTNYSMRIRVIGSKVGSSVMATEVHEIAVRTTGAAVVLPLTGDINLADPAVNFASQGWSVSFSNPATTTLRIACNPGADNVIFMARVEWSALPGA